MRSIIDYGMISDNDCVEPGLEALNICLIVSKIRTRLNTWLFVVSSSGAIGWQYEGNFVSLKRPVWRKAR